MRPEMPDLNEPGKACEINGSDDQHDHEDRIIEHTVKTVENAAVTRIVILYAA